MSDINPDFSFPCASPRSAPTLPPAPIHSPRPLSFSPQSPRLRKHAHRRSAALSEDLGIAEIASLTSPQMPTPSSFLNPPSPGVFGSPSASPMLISPHKAQSDKTPKRDFFDSRAHAQVLNSPLPKQKHQIGEPGQLVALPSLSPPSEPSSEAPVSEGKEKSEKSRKRRSFVQLLRRSINHASEPRQMERQASDSLNSPLKSKSKGKQVATSFSPPQSPLEGDDTLTAPAQLQPPFTAFKTPAMQQVSLFSGGPIETPRTSGEMSRDNEPLPPTINLDEALSCSFSHRKESILESPFSKASSIMSAVLEEDEDERDQSGSDSLSSVHPPRLQQQPHALLYKTNSVSSSVSSCRNPPASPRYIPEKLPGDETTAKFNSGTRTISYVGPVFTSSSPSSSPSRSPRVSFEQVSNLAILDPVESSTRSSPRRSLPSKDSNLKESQKQLNIAPLDAPHDPTKKGHQRRRSLIDRIMRRQV